MAKSRTSRTTRARAVIDAGLGLVACQKPYRYIQSLRGKLKCEGDVRTMRHDR